MIEINVLKLAIGYSLLQIIENKTYLIDYNDQKLSFIKINYSVYKKKVLAIKSVIDIQNYYIDNRKKTIILTEHKSFKYLQRIKNSLKQSAQKISEFAKYNPEIWY